MRINNTCCQGLINVVNKAESLVEHKGMYSCDNDSPI